jgi:hypothetical protein
MPDGLLWAYSGPPLTQAVGTLNSPWFELSSQVEDSKAISQALLWWAVAGGTTTVTVQGSFDGVTVDADLAYTVTSGTPFSIISPYFRVNVVQAAADATTTKLTLIGRI